MEGQWRGTEGHCLHLLISLYLRAAWGTGSAAESSRGRLEPFSV